MNETRPSNWVSLYDVPDFGPCATLPGLEMPEMPLLQEIIGDTGSDRARRCTALHTADDLTLQL